MARFRSKIAWLMGFSSARRYLTDRTLFVNASASDTVIAEVDARSRWHNSSLNFERRERKNNIICIGYLKIITKKL